MRRVFLLALIALLALPGTALASIRYASPGGGTAVGCPQASPCSLSYSITAAATNDEIVVTPGTYSLAATIETETPLNIHGEAGQPRPRIIGASGVTPFKSFVRQSLSDLAFEASDTLEGAIFAPANGTLFDHLELLASGTDALALRPGNNFTLINSLLVASGVGANGLFLQGTEPGTAQLRGDTIIASGSESIGVSIYVTAAATTVTIDATNVIADAATGASAGATAGSTGAIDFDHSNLPTTKGPVTSSSGQTVPPLFVNAAAGDYHEASGSPTIDAGINDLANGSTDLDGNPRSLPGHLTCAPRPPGVTDIGAYEYVASAPPCVPNVEALQTKITKVKLHGRRALFRFTGSGAASLGFTCKLDRRPWRPCKSPEIYKHLKAGKHTFGVRASSNGDFDPTPARRGFTIHSVHSHGSRPR